MGLLVIHGKERGAGKRISTRYTPASPGAMTVKSCSWWSPDRRVAPFQIAVVNEGGALLRTCSVTGPPAGNRSPAYAVPEAFAAVNTNAGGVAAPSRAV